MRKAIIICSIIVLFSSCNLKNTRKNTESEANEFEYVLKGIEINGVIWATNNLGAKYPEDYGNYYTWEKARAACPKGWRLPTIEEFEMFKNIEFDEDIAIDEDDENAYYAIEQQVPSIWTTLNGRNGRKFTDKITRNSIFLPATGFRSFRDGSLVSAGKRGDYWSADNEGFGLYINSSCADLSYYSKECALPIRCVAE
jgi:uncharacterized protein (TIGR02145 family)